MSIFVCLVGKPDATLKKEDVCVHTHASINLISIVSMAKYLPNEMVSEWHGKSCQHSKITFAKRNNTLFTQTRCNPRDMEKKPYTLKERKVHEWFKATRLAIKNLTEEQKAAYQEQFRTYTGTHYNTLNGFIFGAEFALVKAADPIQD